MVFDIRITFENLVPYMIFMLGFSKVMLSFGMYSMMSSSVNWRLLWLYNLLPYRVLQNVVVILRRQLRSNLTEFYVSLNFCFYSPHNGQSLDLCSSLVLSPIPIVQNPLLKPQDIPLEKWDFLLATAG